MTGPTTDAAYKKVEELAFDVELLLIWEADRYVLVRRGPDGLPSGGALVTVPFGPNAYRTITNFIRAYHLGRGRAMEGGKRMSELGYFSGWFPIATAPRDGTVIDVWLGDSGPAGTSPEEVDVTFYCDPVPGSRRSTNWRYQNGEFRPALGLSVGTAMPVFVVPTHWRKLPDPPEEE